VPSCALTTVLIVLDPTVREIASLGVPDATAVSLTVTVAVESVTVGVTVMEVMAYGTLAV